MLPEFLKSINHDLVLLVGALMIAGVGYFTAETTHYLVSEVTLPSIVSCACV